MDRSGLAGGRRCPGNAVLDGKVDLERAGTVAEPAVGTGDSARQPGPENVGGDRWRHVQHQHLGRREITGRGHALPGLDPAAVAFDVGGEGRGDRLRAPFRHYPPLGMRGDDQHHPDGAGHRPVKAMKGMRRDASPERSGLLRPPQPSERRGREDRRAAEASQCSRMSGYPKNRLGDVGEQVAEPRGHRSEHATPSLTVAPQPTRRQIDRSTQHPGRSVVQRVGTINRWVAPGEAGGGEVQTVQER